MATLRRWAFAEQCVITGGSECCGCPKFLFWRVPLTSPSRPNSCPAFARGEGKVPAPSVGAAVRSFICTARSAPLPRTMYRLCTSDSFLEFSKKGSNFFCPSSRPFVSSICDENHLLFQYYARPNCELNSCSKQNAALGQALHLQPRASQHARALVVLRVSLSVFIFYFWLVGKKHRISLLCLLLDGPDR